jgi:AcrR family transcriptional regulator
MATESSAPLKRGYRYRLGGRPDQEPGLTAAPQRAPRKDQVRNRRKLLDAARRAFAEQGPDLSIEAVARAAGVGATTFYRHFPTKDDLVSQLLEDLAGGARQVAEEAAAVPDDWEAFRAVFTRGCALDDEGLRLFDALCRTSAHAAEQGRAIATSLVAPVAGRAQGAGRLRRDVTPEDVAALMRMADSASAPRQRNLTHEVMLAGLRTPTAG